MVKSNCSDQGTHLFSTKVKLVNWATGQVYYQVLLLLVGVPPLTPGPEDRPVGAGGGQGPALAARGDGGGDAAEHDHLRHLALPPLSDQRTVKLMAYQVGQGCILF